jgi:AraC-like DNA-binding protein
MLKFEQSERIGWASQEGDPAVHHFGLPYFPGEKVSVSLGRLASSIWGGHWTSWTRIIFTFNNAFGQLESTCGDPYGDSRWNMLPNQFCIIPPYMETTLDWVTTAELAVLYVETSAFGDRDRWPHGFAGEGFRPLAQRDRRLAQLAQVFLTCCRELERPEPCFVEAVGVALASRALAQYSLSGDANPKSRSGLPLAMVDHVTKHIDAHLSDAILARDLARRVGLSPDHFARRFKITTQMGPKQFALKRRVEKVHELLASGKFNVTEAGREVGFHDLSHLNRCFRNFFGCSPKAVLKNALAADSSQ